MYLSDNISCYSINAGCTALPALLNIKQVMQQRQVTGIWNGKDELPVSFTVLFTIENRDDGSNNVCLFVCVCVCVCVCVFNPLTPKDPYSGRTAPLTSKLSFYIFIQQIQVLNILNTVCTVRFFLFKMQYVS